MKDVTGKAIQQLQRELHSLHNDEALIEILACKLEFAAKETIRSIVNGVRPTTEVVKKHIDMERLLFIKCKKCKKHFQKCKCECECKIDEPAKGQEDYAAVVLRVCEHVQETLLVSLFYSFLIYLFALD